MICVNLFEYLKVIYYEIRARFVIQKVKYKIEGECIRCGDCCRYMYSIDTYNEKEFEFMTKLFPKYKRFKVIGRDEFNNLIFACKLIGEDGLCTDYKNRLKMCKEYPHYHRLCPSGELHERCGFKIIPEKTFEYYLKEK
ncbi:MAG: hypothetical protein ACD_20C00022G0023 [uncultured bacterium]|nr:MAG: hypothetical protein ACD_20C00022G0023 [uncultured bacterium]